MSGRVRTRSKSKQRKGNGESNQPAALVAAQQPSDNQPQQEQAPTESQDIMADQEKEVKEALVDQGPEMKGHTQELAQPQPERKKEDGPVRRQ